MLLGNFIHPWQTADQFQISRLKIIFNSNHCKEWVSTKTVSEGK